MSSLTNRATVYLEPQLHRALRIKAAETSQSMSALINKSLQQSLAEDAEDLAVFEERSQEPLISFESFLKELKHDGRI